MRDFKIIREVQVVGKVLETVCVSAENQEGAERKALRVRFGEGEIKTNKDSFVPLSKIENMALQNADQLIPDIDEIEGEYATVKIRRAEMKFHRITGYWKNDKSLIDGYIIVSVEVEDCPVDDDEIFFYGMGVPEIKEAKDVGSDYEFVILTYKEIDFTAKLSKRKEFSVLVGNIGNIACENREEAEEAFSEYVEQSKTGYGRASDEDVCIMEDGEPIKEYFAP